MGRSTIVRQINKELYSKQAFGESRHVAKQELREHLGDKFSFGMTDDKIHSYETFNTYKKACLGFAKWLVSVKGVNKYSKLNSCKEYAKEYINYRLDHDKVSMWTVKMERSALSKLFGEKIEIELPKRNIKEITRSRFQREGDRHFSIERNKELIIIAKATGARRSDLRNIRPRNFRIDEKGNMWIEIYKSKGGRNRTAPILPEYRALVQDIIRDREPDKRIFRKIHTRADIHSYRREYAQNLYIAFKENREFRDNVLKQYPARREFKTIKDKNGNRIRYEIKSQYITTRKGVESRTYYRDDIYCVSQALGHNRLDVTISHYLS